MMTIDMQTAVCEINFISRRQLKRLPEKIVFELRELDGTYTSLGVVMTAWCMDEVAGESGGAAAVEYQFLFIQNDHVDLMARQCTTVKVDQTRYEKRAVDPAVGSPAVVRLRAQTITGYSSY